MYLFHWLVTLVHYHIVVVTDLSTQRVSLLYHEMISTPVTGEKKIECINNIVCPHHIFLQNESVWRLNTL